MTPAGHQLTPEIAVLGIALGLLFSLVCYLATNLSPGGMITPGWLALTLVEDWRRVIVIAVVIVVTMGGIVLLRRFVILYGKRLFATVVMLAVLLQMTIFLTATGALGNALSNQTLGFIVPGLVAYQLLRQPIRATLVATFAVTVTAYGVLITGVLLNFVKTG